MSDDAKAVQAQAAVEKAVRRLPEGRYLLAVSGGRDSMVLMDAFARTRRDAVSIATFDHCTGRAARRAAELVTSEGARLGIPVVVARRRGGGAAGEAAWRAARWEFFRGTAARLEASVVTAHSRDDQLETVVMRVLRETGPRGLAAMYAESPVVRPLLLVSREIIGRYAESRAVVFVRDPSNEDRRYLRNRVRHDLLPALERERPGFGADMLALAERAARWRIAVEGLVSLLGVTLLVPGRSLAVPLVGLHEMEAAALAVLWPAIAGRVGVRLDWRGTKRLVEFTIKSRIGARIPLSGGASVRRTSTSLVLEASGRYEPLYSYNDRSPSIG
jgi:tRNA(Ile)-lysidine synthase